MINPLFKLKYRVPGHEFQDFEHAHGGIPCVKVSY